MTFKFLGKATKNPPKRVCSVPLEWFWWIKRQDVCAALKKRHLHKDFFGPAGVVDEASGVVDENYVAAVVCWLSSPVDNGLGFTKSHGYIALTAAAHDLTLFN